MTDIGVITPAVNEDVLFATNLQWSGNPGTATLNWTVDNGMAGDLAISPDTLGARLVTAPGDFTAVVTVSAPGGVSDTATVTRAQGVVTVIGLSGSVVPKA